MLVAESAVSYLVDHRAGVRPPVHAIGELDGETALTRALIGRQVDTVRMLLAHGTEPNVRF